MLHGPGVVKVLMSTPDDMVLNHMDLRSVEVAIPSLRFWDLIGRDLDCCNREVSIEAIKHLEKSILKWLLKRQFWKFACPIWTGSVDRLRAFLCKWKLKICFLSDWVGFRFVIIVRGDGSGRTRKRLEHAGCSLVSQIQVRLQSAVSIAPSRFKLRLSLSVGGWKLKQKDLRVPGKGAGTICCLFKTADAERYFS